MRQANGAALRALRLSMLMDADGLARLLASDEAWPMLARRPLEGARPPRPAPVTADGARVLSWELSDEAVPEEVLGRAEALYALFLRCAAEASERLEAMGEAAEVELEPDFGDGPGLYDLAALTVAREHWGACGEAVPVTCAGRPHEAAWALAFGAPAGEAPGTGDREAYLRIMGAKRSALEDKQALPLRRDPSQGRWEDDLGSLLAGQALRRRGADPRWRLL